MCAKPLLSEEVGFSAPCSEATGNVKSCNGGGVLIGGWAVGGAVSFILHTCMRDL